MTQARAFFSIIPVGSTHPRLLAIGGRGETSTLQTSEWWEEEEDRWQEGPPLSTGRSSFSAVMAPPHHVCSEIDLNTHTCPGDGDAQTCSLPTMTSGTSINSKDNTEANTSNSLKKSSEFKWRGIPYSVSHQEICPLSARATKASFSVQQIQTTI